LLLGPLSANVEALLDHPRLVSLHIDGSPDKIWATAKAVADTRRKGGRVIAVGTSVVRALEDAATLDGRLRSGEGVAKGRIGPATQLRLVDAILSGTHERGTSHYELLRAFLEDSTLDRATNELDHTAIARMNSATRS
jgi:S-adenosylmethionine:tRNA-ribosyltransferase-isomerase (queuine synthetase)